MEVDRARTPGPACAVRAQRDEIRLRSIRDPTWRNASPGDIAESTPPRGWRPTPPGAGRSEDRGRLGDSGPEAPVGGLGLVRVMVELSGRCCAVRAGSESIPAGEGGLRRARSLPGRREADPGEGKGAGAAPSNSLDS